MDLKKNDPETAAVDPVPVESIAAKPADARPGRHDEAYLRDQAEQRRAATRFDSTRFRRKQDAGTAPKYTR